jgi:hypothetical protein
MPFYTPLIYIFSVLEVNIAIIDTFATNKIWVVNEIEVRVETTTRGSTSTNGDVDLGEQGPWTKLESKDDYGGQTRRLSVVAKSFDRPSTRSHKHKPSTASSMGRTVGVETAGRYSQESQRNLCRLPSVDIQGGGRARSASRTPSRSDRGDWFAEVGRQNSAATSQSNNFGTVEVIPLQENMKI